MSAQTGELELPPTDLDRPRLPGNPQLWSRADRRWDRVRHTLLVGWLLVILATPVFGERTSTWSEVRGLVASGQIHAVRVSQELPLIATHLR